MRPRQAERVSPRIRAAVEKMRKIAAKGIGGSAAGSALQASAVLPPRMSRHPRTKKSTAAAALAADEFIEDDGDDGDDGDVNDGDEDEENDVEDEGIDDEYDPLAPKGPLENNNYGEVWVPVQARPRRNRKSNAVRRLIQENVVKPSALIYPLFVHDEVSTQCDLLSRCLWYVKCVMNRKGRACFVRLRTRASP